MYQENSNPSRQDYQTMPTRGGHYTDQYLGNPNFNGFDTKSIRSAFVLKVFTIVSVQLAVASILIAWFTLHLPTKQYFQQYGSAYSFAALGLVLVVYFILICVESSRRSFPINFILLGLLTLGYGLIAAILSSQYNTYTVLCAVGATAFTTIVIGLLAKYSPFDLTTCGCGLCILGLIHLLVSLLLIAILAPMGYASTASLIVAGLGAFLISLYMMFDLQLIMGGRRGELSPEEYILAATLLYIDIIQIFQYMLILFGSRE